MTTPTPKLKQPAAEIIPQQVTAPAALSLPAPESTQIDEKRSLYWGDWRALQIWMLCALLLAAMHVYNLIAGLFWQSGPIR